MEEDSSFRSERQLTLIALEKHNANLLLEIVHLPANPRLRDVQLPCGRRKAAMFSYRAKVSEMAQLHMEAAYHRFPLSGLLIAGIRTNGVTSGTDRAQISV
jgi:hypothetical protein